MSNNTATVHRVSILNFVNKETIEFSVPFANGIYVLPCEFVMSKHNPIYYGDEIDFQFWGSLNTVFGTITDSDPILTLQTGYRYVWDYYKKTFKVYDETGALSSQRKNINSIADLHIDFTIHKSHQFEIIIDQYLNDSNSFFLLGKFYKKLYGESPVVKVNGNVFNDELSYVKTQHGQNYVSFEYRCYNRKSDIFGTYIERRVDKVRRTEQITSIICNNGMWFDNLRIDNALYTNKFDTFNAKHLKQKLKGKSVNNDSGCFKQLVVSSATTIYPIYHDLLRPKSMNNNRPLYEPYLIWKVYKFKWLHRRKPDDDYEINVFDLSPNWSY